MWRLIYFIPIWIIWSIFIILPYKIVGWFIVPRMYSYRFMPYEAVLQLRPRWRAWLNPEDWEGGVASYKESLPRWWWDEIPALSQSRRDWIRYHRRNVTNGLRTYHSEWPYTGLKIEQSKVKWVGSRYEDNAWPYLFYYPWYMRHHWPSIRFYWYLAWQGWRAGIRVVYHWNDTRHFAFKLGWNVSPIDAFETNPERATTRYGARFAHNLHIYDDED